jgi:Type VI secretion system/phage-baseplate injector OB domain
VQFEVGDEVLVAFENGDSARPFVIGMLWQGSAPPPEQTGTRTVHLSAEGVLHPITGGMGANGASLCATTADLQRQAAPWLASMACLLRVLALLKPLIDIVKSLPTPAPASIVAFDEAAAALEPCLMMNTPVAALPLVKDLLCLTLQSLKCLQSLPPAEQAQAAAGIQGVLDLGAVFFSFAGVAPIRLATPTNPAGLVADINTIQAVVNALGGCG